MGTHPCRRIRALTALVGAVVILCVDPSAALAADDGLQALAARYAPVVRLSEQLEPCAGGEAYEPIDVNVLFGNDEVALRGPWQGANLVKVGPRASDLASGRYGYALDFPGDALSSSSCSYEQWQRRITAGRRPTVYAHAAVEDGKLALQYWFFYVYNDFNNKHEGDWEVIQLDFDAPTPAAALRTPPFEVGFSQHAGAERAEWKSDKLELVGGTHPIVYPAEGSHANYFSGALFLGRSAAQGVGCDDTNEPWRQLSPRVAVIPRVRQAALSAYPWLGYQGRWGERRRSFYDAPTGPNTKSQWTSPITWANDTWRSKSFTLAGGRSLGPTATRFFCGGVGSVSSALIFVTSRPAASAVVALALLVLLLWAATRTGWAVALATRAARTYAGNARCSSPSARSSSSSARPSARSSTSCSTTPASRRSSTRSGPRTRSRRSSCSRSASPSTCSGSRSCRRPARARCASSPRTGLRPRPRRTGRRRAGSDPCSAG